jgi:MFS family permease
MTIYLIRLTSWCSWGVLYPFLAVWLLRQGLLDGAAVGLVVGAAVITSRVGALVFAPLVERFQKRTVIIAAQVAVVLTAIALHTLSATAPFSIVPWLAAAALFGLAHSVSTLAQITFIADQVPADRITRAFSYENVALNVGAGIAPLLSSLVITTMPTGYALAPIPFAVVTAGLARTLARDPVAAGPPPPAAVRPVAGRWMLPLFLAMNFLTLLAYAQFYGVFPARAEPSLGATRVGLLFAFSSVVIVLCQVPVTVLTARLGERTLVVAANLLTAAGTALLLRAGTGIVAALAAVLLVTLGEMVYGPVYQAIAVRLRPDRPTYALGTLTFVWGVAESSASVVGLALLGMGLGTAPFLLAAAGCLVAAAIGSALLAPRFSQPAAAARTATGS